MAKQLIDKKYSNRSVKLNIKPGFCYYCEKDLLPEDIFCMDCGFPQKKSETEQRVFIGNKRKQVKELEELYKHQKGARQTLLILFVINLLLFLFYLFSEDASLADAISQGVLAALYAGLWIWSKTQLRQATFTGIIIYLTFLVLYAIFDPISIISGLMFKAIIIFALVSGYVSVKKADAFKKEMEGKNLFNK